MRLTSSFGFDGLPVAGTGRIQREPVGRVLLHLFEHQIHHRGQEHAILSGTHVKPPQLHEFFLGDPKEQGFRQEDFSELGYSEAAIWR